MPNDEIDLHEHTWAEAREAFVAHYNGAVVRGDKTPFRAIHGKGSAGAPPVLRPALRTFLTDHGIRWERAAFSETMDGHTLVYPSKPLPTATDRLQTAILAYCETPKTKEKIMGEFRRHSVPVVAQALKDLQGRKMLKAVQAGGKKQFTTA